MNYLAQMSGNKNCSKYDTTYSRKLLRQILKVGVTVNIIFPIANLHAFRKKL